MNPTPTITIDEATATRLSKGAAVFFQDETCTLFFLTRITQCGDRPWRWAFVALTTQAEPRCLAKSVRSAIRYALDDDFAPFVADSLEGVLAAIQPNTLANDTIRWIDALTNVEKAHFRTTTDTGAAEQALIVWNALRKELGLPRLEREHLPAWNGERYEKPAGSTLLPVDITPPESGHWIENSTPRETLEALHREHHRNEGHYTVCGNAVDSSDGTRVALALNAPSWPLTASLIAEALNVHAETGKGPRQIQAERDELAQWKESALAVERDWSLEAIGKLCGLTIGDDIRPAIQPTLENLIALLRSLLNSGRFGGDSDPLAKRIHQTLRNLNQI